MMKLEHETDGSIAKLAQLGFVPSVNGLPTDYYIAASGFVQCSQYVHQRALSRAARTDDSDHLTALHREINSVEHVQLVPISTNVRLVHVMRFEHVHRHSCLIASIGKSRDACTDGYTVAIAAIAILARMIHITSLGCVV